MIAVLVDVEHRVELPTSMSMHHWVPMHGHREAAFSVHKSNHPVGIEHDTRTGSFLLIVRTSRIFTTHAGTLKNGCDVNEYRWILGCSSIQWGFVTARY